MRFLKRPSNEHVDRFIATQSRFDFTYPSVGATRNGEHPPGFILDHNRAHLGQGEATFRAAKRALCDWRHFALDWIELHPPEVAPAPGRTVAVSARALGFWMLNACRIVYVLEERQPVRRFSFAYGTLPEHAESGEERFQVEWHEEDDSVWYGVLAFSRPNQLSSRLAYPYVRRKQRQFARESALAMKTAVASLERT